MSDEYTFNRYDFEVSTRQSTVGHREKKVVTIKHIASKKKRHYYAPTPNLRIKLRDRIMQEIHDKAQSK